MTKLLTLSEYEALAPFEQGYASYMQAEWPGSPLPKENPYLPDSPRALAWAKGEARAVQHAQDSEE